MTDERKYAFDWSLIGNIDEGRPNLGSIDVSSTPGIGTTFTITLPIKT